MQKIFFVIVLLAITAYALAQGSPAESVASKIALKMKDSLSLTQAQRAQIYSINIQLHNQKASARQQFGATDSLGRVIQRIEYTRDSLYGTVLTEQQMIQYKEKKASLISNN
jgi:hypothetical protein